MGTELGIFCNSLLLVEPEGPNCAVDNGGCPDKCEMVDGEPVCSCSAFGHAIAYVQNADWTYSTLCREYIHIFISLNGGAKKF